MEAAIFGFIGTAVGALTSISGIFLKIHNSLILHVELLKLERNKKFHTSLIETRLSYYKTRYIA